MKNKNKSCPYKKLCVFYNSCLRTFGSHLVYRKPTTTDTTINFMSYHPIEQKTAAYRFHITRIQSLPLDPSKKQKELETIQYIAMNNNFPQNLLQKLNRQIHNKINHTHTHTIEIKTIKKEFGPHLPTTVPKYRRLPTYLETPR